MAPERAEGREEAMEPAKHVVRRSDAPARAEERAFALACSRARMAKERAARVVAPPSPLPRQRQRLLRRYYESYRMSTQWCRRPCAATDRTMRSESFSRTLPPRLHRQPAYRRANARARARQTRRSNLVPRHSSTAPTSLYTHTHIYIYARQISPYSSNTPVRPAARRYPRRLARRSAIMASNDLSRLFTRHAVCAPYTSMIIAPAVHPIAYVLETNGWRSGASRRRRKRRRAVAFSAPVPLVPVVDDEEHHGRHTRCHHDASWRRA